MLGHLVILFLVVPVCHNLYIFCGIGHLQERIWVQICCHWVL